MERQLYEAWFGVAIASDIELQSSQPVINNDIELALWRGENGEIHVWKDECPHRGMRLSLGYVRGNELNCLYHGWKYDANGQCNRIPAHNELTPAKTICATAYPVQIKAGIVFTSLEQDANPELVELPSGDWNPVRSIYINRPPDALENSDLLTELFSGAVQTTASNVLQIERTDEADLSLAIQSVSTNKSAIHMTYNGAPDYQIALDLAQKLIQLRHILESERG